MKYILKASQLAFIAAMLLMPLAKTKAQTPSTEGKEFWVTLTIGDNNENKKEFLPYLAVSAKNACTVNVTNPNTGWTKTYNVGNNSWTEIKDIPLIQWYPSTSTDNAQDPNLSENVYKNGLIVTSTEEISLFSAHRQKYSFDASNVLPTTALSDNYMTQDYPPSEQRACFVVLATENNTTVEITPTAETVKGKAEQRGDISRPFQTARRARRL